MNDDEKRAGVCLAGQAEAPISPGGNGKRLPPPIARLLGGRLAGIDDRATVQSNGPVGQCDGECRAARWLGIGIANAVTLFGVERVVLTGGMSALGKRLITPVLDEIHDRVRMFPPGEVMVERSTIGDGAGLLGAIAWAAENTENYSWTIPTQT